MLKYNLIKKSQKQTINEEGRQQISEKDPYIDWLNSSEADELAKAYAEALHTNVK